MAASSPGTRPRCSDRLCCHPCLRPCSYRMLKYSPEHMHCLATVWGPLAPPNTGAPARGLRQQWAWPPTCLTYTPASVLAGPQFAPCSCLPCLPFSLPQQAGVLAVQKLEGQQANWRIAATGVVLQLDASLRIVKKLKLVGTPFKVGGMGRVAEAKGVPAADAGSWCGWLWVGELTLTCSCPLRPHLLIHRSSQPSLPAHSPLNRSTATPPLSTACSTACWRPASLRGLPSAPCRASAAPSRRRSRRGARCDGVGWGGAGWRSGRSMAGACRSVPLVL